MIDGQRDDTTPVVLVDRTTLGGYEFLFDGRPFVFKPGRMKLTVGADVARHVFRHEHDKVWTTDGQYVHRLALEDAPGFDGIAARLGQELGEEIVIQDPIEIDTRRAEGWDTRQSDRGRVAVVPLNTNPADFRDRQGAASSVSYAER
jgi:hypothetical protein